MTDELRDLAIVALQAIGVGGSSYLRQEVVVTTLQSGSLRLMVKWEPSVGRLTLDKLGGRNGHS